MTIHILFAFLVFVCSLLWVLTQFSFEHKRLAAIGSFLIVIWLVIVGGISAWLFGVALSGHLPADEIETLNIIVFVWKLLVYGFLPVLITFGVFHKRNARIREQ